MAKLEWRKALAAQNGYGEHDTELLYCGDEPVAAMYRTKGWSVWLCDVRNGKTYRWTRLPVTFAFEADMRAYLETIVRLEAV